MRLPRKERMRPRRCWSASTALRASSSCNPLTNTRAKWRSGLTSTSVIEARPSATSFTSKRSTSTRASRTDSPTREVRRVLRIRCGVYRLPRPFRRPVEDQPRPSHTHATDVTAAEDAWRYTARVRLLPKTLLLALLAAAPAFAATRTWRGVIDTKWSTPVNWDGGVPVSGDDVVLGA